jgi:hypothetical protein
MSSPSLGVGGFPGLGQPAGELVALRQGDDVLHLNRPLWPSQLTPKDRVSPPFGPFGATIADED